MTPEQATLVQDTFAKVAPIADKAADLFYGCDVHELGPRLDPFQNLSAHYLLIGMRTP